MTGNALTYSAPVFWVAGCTEWSDGASFLASGAASGMPASGTVTWATIPTEADPGASATIATTASDPGPGSEGLAAWLCVAASTIANATAALATSAATRISARLFGGRPLTVDIWYCGSSVPV